MVLFGLFLILSNARLSTCVQVQAFLRSRRKLPATDTNTTRIAELPNQLWLSSCSPRDLIHKYKRYLHGPANGIAGDRRVVMDEKMLPEDEMRAGFRVFEPKHLLERFLATLEFEIKEAARINQPVLVLIFGHGEEKTSGIFIGCGEGGHLRLTQPRLASVLKKGGSNDFDFDIMLLRRLDYDAKFKRTVPRETCVQSLPSCRSGIRKSESSWSLSQTAGRQAGGSIFATFPPFHHHGLR
jgi:hypothetical protein